MNRQKPKVSARRIKAKLSLPVSDYWMATVDEVDAYAKTLEHLQKMPMAELQASMREHEQMQDGRNSHLTMLGDVAVIRIEGLILNKSTWITDFLGLVTYEGIRQDLAEAVAENPTAIILHMASPGGTAYGVMDTADMIKQIDSKIPVYSYVDTIAASAAYWLAASAREVIAHPMAETGSIGTFTKLVSHYRADREGGYDVETIRAGEFKALGQSSEEITDKARGTLQKGVDRINEFFTTAVKRYRNLTDTQLREEAGEGRTFIGKDGKSVGLVDEIGKFSEIYTRIEKAHRRTAKSGSAGRAPAMQESEDMKRRKLTEAGILAVQAGTVTMGDAMLSQEYSEEFEDAVEGAEGEGKGSQTQEAKANAGEGSTGEPKTSPTEAMADATVLDKLLNVMQEKTLLSAELAQAKETLQAKESDLAGVKATLDKACELLLQSVNSMAVALNSAKLSGEHLTAELIVDTYSQYSTQLRKSIPVGRVSSDTLGDDKTATSSAIPPSAFACGVN